MPIDIDSEVQTPWDQRLFAIRRSLNSCYSRYSVDKVWRLTNIDEWFLNMIKGYLNYVMFKLQKDGLMLRKLVD